MSAESENTLARVTIAHVGDKKFRDRAAQYHPDLDKLVALAWDNRYKLKTDIPKPMRRRQAITGIRLEPGYSPGMVFATAAERYKIGPYLTPKKIKQMMSQEASRTVVDYAHRALNDVERLGSDSIYHLGLSTNTRHTALGVVNDGGISKLREALETGTFYFPSGMRGELYGKLEEFDSQVNLLKGFGYTYESIVDSGIGTEMYIKRELSAPLK